MGMDGNLRSIEKRAESSQILPCANETDLPQRNLRSDRSFTEAQAVSLGQCHRRTIFQVDKVDIPLIRRPPERPPRQSPTPPASRPRDPAGGAEVLPRGTSAGGNEMFICTLLTDELSELQCWRKGKESDLYE